MFYIIIYFFPFEHHWRRKMTYTGFFPLYMNLPEWKPFHVACSEHFDADCTGRPGLNACSGSLSSPFRSYSKQRSAIEREYGQVRHGTVSKRFVGSVLCSSANGVNNRKGYIK